MFGSGLLAGNTNYTNLLEAYGVKIKHGGGDSLATEPELLGHKRQYVWPARSTEPSTGAVKARFQVVEDFSINKRRFFPEHGLVAVYCGFRLPYFLDGKHGLFQNWRTKQSHFVGPFMTDDWFVDFDDADHDKAWLAHATRDHVDTREEMFRGETVFIGRKGDGSADKTQAELFHQAHSGDEEPQDIARARDPGVNDFLLEDNSPTGSDFQFTGLLNCDFRTPIPPMQVVRRGYA